MQLSALHQEVMAVNEVVLWGRGRGGAGWGRGRRDTERKRGGGGAIKRGGSFQRCYFSLHVSGHKCQRCHYYLDPFV